MADQSGVFEGVDFRSSGVPAQSRVRENVRGSGRSPLSLGEVGRPEMRCSFRASPCDPKWDGRVADRSGSCELLGPPDDCSRSRRNAWMAAAALDGEKRNAGCPSGWLSGRVRDAAGGVDRVISRDRSLEVGCSCRSLRENVGRPLVGLGCLGGSACRAVWDGRLGDASRDRSRWAFCNGDARRSDSAEWLRGDTWLRGDEGPRDAEWLRGVEWLRGDEGPRDAEWLRGSAWLCLPLGRVLCELW